MKGQKGEVGPKGDMCPIGDKGDMVIIFFSMKCFLKSLFYMFFYNRVTREKKDKKEKKV